MTVKPWGKFEQFTLNEKSTVKLIYINPEQRTSLQTHKNRSETWCVVRGQCQVIVGDLKMNLYENGIVHIPVGMPHRIIGLDERAVILEIAFGEFDEADIVRIQDDYERI